MFMQRTSAPRGTPKTARVPTGKPLQRSHRAAESANATGKGSSAPRLLTWDFDSLPLFPSERSRPLAVPSGALQQKLEIGAVDDPLEREADAIAGKVMRIPDPALSFLTARPQVSRACASCDREDEEKTLRRKPAGATTSVDAAPPIVHEALRRPGQPLDAATRAFFEPRFGHDIGAVRVHADSLAHDSAVAVKAKAYTVGRDIVFQKGDYEPNGAAGRALLAHELAHTIQQGVIRPSGAKEAPSEPAAKIASSHAVQRQPARETDNSGDFPLVNAELVLDPSKPQRCCTCGTPPCLAHLGPPSAGDPTAQNGMNLVATLLHTIASSRRSLDYGFVQIVRARRCLELLPAQGGGWSNVLERPSGSNDVFDACATCTVPRVRGGLPEIVFSDAPGFALPNARIGSPAFGNQLVQKGNFETWVIAREGKQPWRRISDPVRWHSLSWIRRNAAGNWELNPGHNLIGPGWTTFGPGCPP